MFYSSSYHKQARYLFLLRRLLVFHLLLSDHITCFSAHFCVSLMSLFRALEIAFAYFQPSSFSNLYHFMRVHANIINPSKNIFCEPESTVRASYLHLFSQDIMLLNRKVCPWASSIFLSIRRFPPRIFDYNPAISSSIITGRLLIVCECAIRKKSEINLHRRHHLVFQCLLQTHSFLLGMHYFFLVSKHLIRAISVSFLLNFLALASF